MMAMLLQIALAGASIPSSGAYVCEVQTILPTMDRLERVQVHVADDSWEFDSALAAFTGVERAKRLLVDGQPILSGAVAGDPAARFEAKTGLSDDETRFVIDWTVRKPMAGVDEATLVNSGLAICDLEPDSSAQEKSK